ncbi:cupin domain-containing protein [Alphaproteobacteria bacterium KMM 3653]|uniref:Cupin domain-containing protein n=1 Tax=Harenicola maris TaxID=2841044 RepID=A0AAP2G8S1_9RHOB|nr:cupin domain-containing protein [Harenicola maris]
MDKQPDEDEPIGKRLRLRRKALGLTMEQVAAEAGLSIGFISQIERSITTPSLTSLANVSRALGASLGDFFAQPAAEGHLTHSAKREKFSIGDNGLVYERVSASFPDKMLNSVIIHEPPGYRSEPNSHEGEEIFFILKGALTLEVEGEVTVLEVGDSIHFRSSRTHASWNHTSETTSFLHTCTMDIFSEGPNAASAPRKDTPAK